MLSCLMERQSILNACNGKLSMSLEKKFNAKAVGAIYMTMPP